MKKVIRLQSYRQSLRELAAIVAKDNPRAAAQLKINIDDQVTQLEDPNFPRKIGRVKGTFELVAHPNYIVILEESAKTVTALIVVHARQQWPHVLGVPMLGARCTVPTTTTGTLGGTGLY